MGSVGPAVVAATVVVWVTVVVIVALELVLAQRVQFRRRAAISDWHSREMDEQLL